MQEKRKITDEIELVGTLRMLAQAYQEISVTKMQKIRGAVLNTRDFLSGLSDVFFDVKSSYKKQIIRLIEKKKLDPTSHFSTLNRNGKTATILLTANNKLYGDIIQKVFHLFIEDISKSSSDILIVGRIGKEMFDQSKSARHYDYFEIPDSDVTFEDLKPLVSKILNYEKANVYYGKFINIVNQVPEAKDISGEEEQAKRGEDAQEEFRFIFEPTLERILNFFETQIFTSFFKQTVNESQLARYASRIMAMEQALDNIDNKLKDLDNRKIRVKRLISNKKQIETISGLSLWSSYEK